MKTSRSWSVKIGLPVILVGLIVLTLSPRTRADLSPQFEKEYEPTHGEFDIFGKAVVELLISHSATAFATNFSETSGDWLSIVTTNLSKAEADRINDFARGTNYNFNRLKMDAQGVLKQADSLHLDFSNENLNYQVVVPKHFGQIFFGSLTAKELTLPYLDKLDVLLFRGSETSQSGVSGFKLTLRGLVKFPAGWRINGGRAAIQWTGFPTNVADANTLRELAISEKIASNEPITSEDDPALLKFGESLVQFIRDRDTNAYKTNLLLNSDTIWAMFEKSGRPGPTRQEVDEEVTKQTQEQVAVAGKLLEMMKASGIDLTNADIQINDARVEHCQLEGESDPLDQLNGSQFSLSLAVKTDARARNGTPLSGDYVLGVQGLIKLGGNWKVEQDVHWVQLPPGVVDAATAANIKFENYVAKYRALPPGMAAPEIEFTTLVGGKKMKLSDLRGKVVALDFWATWCGPCQQPMADLQTIRDNHPGWQDKVVIMPVSIDDTLDIVRKHVDQRGWTNTFNVWAGDGGWRSTTAKAFRVTGVPTSYIIDPQGKITWSGYPDSDGIARMIDAQLKK